MLLTTQPGGNPTTTTPEGGGTGDGGLASTGGPSLWIGLGGIVLLAAGGLAYAIGRQRGRY